MSLIKHLLGEKMILSESRGTPVERVVDGILEGVDIHIRVDKDNNVSVGNVAEEIRTPAARKFTFRIRRDESGKISEVEATKQND